MKKHTCTILLTVMLISSASYAQKTRWGIQAGATYSNITFSYDGEVESDDYKPGFTAGIMMDRKIGKSVFFQSALNFVQKGTQSNDNSEKTSATLNYLEIPLNFVYRSKQESGFFIGGGPGIGFGLGGTSKYGDDKESIDFGGDGNPDVVEVEANFLAGYMFPKKLQIALSYNFGITNLMDDDTFKTKNNYFGLRVGYYFK
jgi:Outer membrane protein beta-barrel domain